MGEINANAHPYRIVNLFTIIYSAETKGIIYCLNVLINIQECIFDVLMALISSCLLEIRN